MIDISKLPTGKHGTIYDGIEICDRNRATVFENTLEGIEILAGIRDNNYLSHNVRAVLFGVRRQADNRQGKRPPSVTHRVRYAVFCEEGFIKELTDENKQRKSKRSKASAANTRRSKVSKQRARSRRR